MSKCLGIWVKNIIENLYILWRKEISGHLGKKGERENLVFLGNGKKESVKVPPTPQCLIRGFGVQLYDGFVRLPRSQEIRLPGSTQTRIPGYSKTRKQGFPESGDHGCPDSRLQQNQESGDHGIRPQPQNAVSCAWDGPSRAFCIRVG